jgi:hypothetical protein
MSRLGALLLLTAGAALGGYCYLVPASDNQTDLAEITRISAAPDRDYQRDATVRTFSPASPVFREVIPEGASEPVAPSPPKAGTWTTVVSSGQAIVTPLKSSRPGDPETRAQLASDLQRELQRVGCYRGEITGTWNLATRRAMAAFMDRANATLPMNDPDYVLLALLQGHQEIVCTAECPAGQVVAESGRCMPRAVVAQAAKKSKRLDEHRLAATRLAGDRQRVAASEPEPEKLPWLTNDKPAELPAATRPEPPQGRMSIGGPSVETGTLPPAGNFTAATPESGRVPIVVAPRDGSGPFNAEGSTRAEPPKVAAVSSYADSDDLAADPNSAVAGADPNAVSLPADGVDPNAHKQKSSRHSEDRPRRNYYASGGRTRRGDPRPGTMRYNIAQSLGGIY